MKAEFRSWSQVRVYGPSWLRQWRTSRGLPVPGREQVDAYRKGFWDGLYLPGVRLTVDKGRADGGVIFTVGRGLLEWMQAHSDDCCGGHTPECCDCGALTFTEIIEPRPGPLPKFEIPKDTPLRDYQLDTLRQMALSRWGRIAHATNAGKGALIGLFAAAARRVGREVTILCDELAVFEALQEQVYQWGKIHPYVVQAEHGRQPPSQYELVAGDNLPTPHVTIAMIQSLHNRLYEKVKGKKKETYHLKNNEWAEWAQRQSVLFLDEADKATSAPWQRVLDAMPNTEYRFGFSGTFPDWDQHNEQAAINALVLEETIGPVLDRVQNIELVERGISARPIITLYPFRHDHIPSVRGPGPTQRAEIFRRCIATLERRHRLIKDLLEPDAPNVVIVNRIEHGRNLANYLDLQGVACRFLHGTDSEEVRRAVIDDFRAGHFQTLVVTSILDRGTNDLGHAVGLIFASAEGSKRQVLQRIGRGLRRAGGKEFLYLKDIMDTGHEYFSEAAKERVRLYNDEGFDVRISS